LPSFFRWNRPAFFATQWGLKAIERTVGMRALPDTEIFGVNRASDTVVKKISKHPPYRLSDGPRNGKALQQATCWARAPVPR
jgi:hypothetical protein